jgi:hypothetical protein
MAQGSPQEARLAFKRAFADYFLELPSAGIADPTEAFTACRVYLSALLEQLGPDEFMRRLDDETTHLAGQVEQDLRHRRRGYETAPEYVDYEDVEDRLRECFEQGLRRLEGPF